MIKGIADHRETTARRLILETVSHHFNADAERARR